LRDEARVLIQFGMGEPSIIDMDKLKADMAHEVERTSGRKFSLAVTGGKNPDFYRNMVNNKQDKRLSAEVFVSIARVLGKSPADYVVGAVSGPHLPNATVLTSTFAVLLDSIGIDPFEDARAQKLAAQFPNALRSIEDLLASQTENHNSPHGEASRAGAEGRKLI
jgi:hypothetical protein